MQKSSNLIVDSSKDFAVRIIKLCFYLKENKTDRELVKQLLKSGTSIGANVHEAIQAQSKADFISKMNIALKEASETEYWLEIFFKANILTESEYKSINEDCIKINKILTSIVKSSK